jgi:hypothetical protein
MPRGEQRAEPRGVSTTGLHLCPVWLLGSSQETTQLNELCPVNAPDGLLDRAPCRLQPPSQFLVDGLGDHRFPIDEA